MAPHYVRVIEANIDTLLLYDVASKHLREPKLISKI